MTFPKPKWDFYVTVSIITGIYITSEIITYRWLIPDSMPFEFIFCSIMFFLGWLATLFFCIAFLYLLELEYEIILNDDIGINNETRI